MTANVCGLKLVQGVERSDRLLDTIILSANLLNQEIGVEIRNRVESAEKAAMIKIEVLLRRRAKELNGK